MAGRDRKFVDSHAQSGGGNAGSGSASPLKDSSRSPAGRRRDVPPPPLPAKDEYDGVGVGDVLHLHLPPPPPELLSDSGGHLATVGEQEKSDLFADDSYGAYRNRGSRQVGTYKRSSSSTLLRPDNQHLKAATDAQHVFGDRRLGNQAWTSDSQLQASRKVELQAGGSSGAPQRPPERGGNVPVDSVPSRSVGRVSGLVAQPAVPSRGWEEGKMFAAHPFRVEQVPVIPEKEVLNTHDAASSSRGPGSEKSVSPSSLPASATNSSSSSGQRWANALPFPSTHHRLAGDEVKPLPATNTIPGSPKSVSYGRSAVLPVTDSHPPGSLDSFPVGSTHHAPASSRSRLPSRHGDVSPSADSKQKLAEVAPFASDPRSLPGHIQRSYSSQTSDPPRPPAPSPYSRRECAPVSSSSSHIPPEAIAMVPPRRKTEDHLLTDATDKDPGSSSEQVLISHGRQPSQEELECDHLAKELAREVADSEKKLSDVLSSEAGKKRMEYINGVFSEPAGGKGQSLRHSSSAGDVPTAKPPPPPPLHSSSHSADEDQLKNRTPGTLNPWLSADGAALKTDPREDHSLTESVDNHLNDRDSLVRHKEEVMGRLQKKLALLKEEKKAMQEEVDLNKAMGKRVLDRVDARCPSPGERDKVHTYVADVEKVVRLLLNLSGQLARAENALEVMGDAADPEMKRRAQEKCEGLRTKYAEARQLKEHVDKRSDTVWAILRQALTPGELRDFQQFVGTSSRLTILLQQLDDEVALNTEQILELRKSIADCGANHHHCQAATSSTANSSLSSCPSPVPIS